MAENTSPQTPLRSLLSEEEPSSSPPSVRSLLRDEPRQPSTPLRSLLHDETPVSAPVIGNPWRNLDLRTLTPVQARQRLQVIEEGMYAGAETHNREQLDRRAAITRRLKQIAQEDSPRGELAEPSMLLNPETYLPYTTFAKIASPVVGGLLLKPAGRLTHYAAETAPVKAALDILRPYGTALKKIGSALAETPLAERTSRTVGHVVDSVLAETAPGMRSEAAQQATYPIRHYAAEERLAQQQLARGQGTETLQQQATTLEATLLAKRQAWDAAWQQRFGKTPPSWQRPVGSQPPAPGAPSSTAPIPYTPGGLGFASIPPPSIPPAEHASWYEYTLTQGYQPNRWKARQREMLRGMLRDVEMDEAADPIHVNSLKRALAQNEEYLANSAYYYMTHRKPLDPRLNVYLRQHPPTPQVTLDPADALDPFTHPEQIDVPPLASQTGQTPKPFWLNRHEAEEAIALSDAHGFAPSAPIEQQLRQHRQATDKLWEQIHQRGGANVGASQFLVTLMEEEDALTRQHGQEALTWLLDQHPQTIPRSLLDRHPYGASMLGRPLRPSRTPYPSQTNVLRTFYDSMEQGRGEFNAPLEAILREARQIRLTALKALPQDVQDAYLWEYWPELWHDPTKAERILENLAEHSEVPHRYLHDRLVVSPVEAMQNGLLPRRMNPVDQVMGELGALDHFLMQHKALTAQQDLGLVRFVPKGEPPPEGWTTLPKAVGQRLQYTPGRRGAMPRTGTGPGQENVTTTGAWYAPEEVVRIWQNWTAPGLRGKGWYDWTRDRSNAMIQLRLGMSGFHAMAESFYAMTSDLGLGLMQLSEGRGLQGLGSLARGLTPYSVYRTAREGRQLLRTALDPTGAPPALTEMVQQLLKGGMSFQRDAAYRIGANSAAGTFWQQLRQHPILATVEKLSEPLMGKLVPWLKVGAAARLAKEELARLGSQASEQQIREAMARVVNSIDNRFGMLAYDNLFWHRTLQDLSHVMVQSVGWNLGSLREGIGAGADLGAALRQVVTGTGNPLLTARMGFVMSLPFVTGLYGGLTHKILTGEWPQTMKDYFFPATGRQQGRFQERLKLPTYIYDMVQLFHGVVDKQDLLAWVIGKTNPLDTTAYELLRNKDYLNLPIYGERGRKPLAFVGEAFEALPETLQAPLQSLYQTLVFLGQSYLPYSLGQAERLGGVEDPGLAAGGLLGVTPAPTWIQETPEQTTARETRERIRIERQRRRLAIPR